MLRAMFVRLGSFAVKAGELETLRETYNTACVPLVRAAPGNVDCFLLEPVAPGDIVACTMWHSEEDAVRYESSGAAAEVVAKVRAHFAGPPALATYRVVRDAAPPAVASPAPHRSPLSTAEPWNLVAADYTAEALRHFEVLARAAIGLAALPPAPRVADVAAGPGTVSLQIAAAGGRVSAIDLSEAMLAELRRRAREADVEAAIDVHHGDAQKLPFESAAYDAAFSMFGLMFFPDRHAGLLEMRRVLKPGGRAVVSSWVPFDGPFGELLKSVTEFIPGIPLGQGKQVMSTADEIADEMKAAGFRDVRVEVVPHAIVAPSFDAFWDSMQRTNAPLVLLRHRLGARWDAAAPKIRERVRSTLGDGELTIGRGAFVGLGVA
jgi:SAM-dependent methyltransferase